MPYRSCTGIESPVRLKVSPETNPLEKSFSREFRYPGHFGTGDLELTVRSLEDFERKAAPASKLRGELVYSRGAPRNSIPCRIANRELLGIMLHTSLAGHPRCAL